MVLVREDNLRRLEWPLAVVTELHPGSDGVDCAVTLKTSKNTISRAVQRIHHLELCDEGVVCQTEGGSSDNVNRRSRYGRDLKPRIMMNL